MNYTQSTDVGESTDHLAPRLSTPFANPLPPDTTPRFTIPEGTSVRVAKVESPEEKRRHTTRQRLDFDSYERWDKEEYCYVFRHQGYLIWASYRRVTKRWYFRGRTFQT